MSDMKLWVSADALDMGANWTPIRRWPCLAVSHLPAVLTIDQGRNIWHIPIPQGVRLLVDVRLADAD